MPTLTTTAPEVPGHVYSLCEAVADLAHNFARQGFVPEDSREFTRLCIEWANEFEHAHAGTEWGQDEGADYIDAIDGFFDAKYSAWIESPLTDKRENR